MDIKSLKELFKPEDFWDAITDAPLDDRREWAEFANTKVKPLLDALEIAVEALKEVSCLTICEKNGYVGKCVNCMTVEQTLEHINKLLGDKAEGGKP